MSSADRVSLFPSESPSFLALFLKFLVGAYANRRADQLRASKLAGVSR